MQIVMFVTQQQVKILHTVNSDDQHKLRHTTATGCLYSKWHNVTIYTVLTCSASTQAEWKTAASGQGPSISIANVSFVTTAHTSTLMSVTPKQTTSTNRLNHSLFCQQHLPSVLNENTINFYGTHVNVTHTLKSWLILSVYCMAFSAHILTFICRAILVITKSTSTFEKDLCNPKVRVVPSGTLSKLGTLPVLSLSRSSTYIMLSS